MSKRTPNVAALVPALQTDLVIEERPIPSPGPGELLIRNHAIGINPIDWKRVAWNYLVPSLPLVLGADLSGEVVEVGPSVTAFKPGDCIIGFAHSLVSESNDNAAYQTYTVIRSNSASLLPPNLSFEQGATLPSAIATATLNFFDVLGLPRLPNEAERKPPQEADTNSSIALVWGGSSSVGFLSIQVARLVGLTVFATASERHHDALRAVGASEVFDYHSSTVVEDIVAAVERSGKRIEYVVDAITEATTIKPILEVLSKFSGAIRKIVTSLPWPENIPKPDGIWADMVHGEQMWVSKQDLCAWLMNEVLAPWLERETIVPLQHRVIEGGISGLQNGLNQLKSGAVSGEKLVVSL